MNLVYVLLVSTFLYAKQDNATYIQDTFPATSRGLVECQHEAQITDTVGLDGENEVNMCVKAYVADPCNHMNPNPGCGK